MKLKVSAVKDVLLSCTLLAQSEQVSQGHASISHSVTQTEKEKGKK